MSSLNVILDESLGPINIQSVALQKMAGGDLSHRITEDFKGDHNRIKDALNQIANLAELAMKELHHLVEASRAGDLKVRTDARSFNGDWREIMTGINTILDEALSPVTAQSELLTKMVAGDLSARITHDFKGDHNRVKELLNQYQIYNQQVVDDLVTVSKRLAEGDLNIRLQGQYKGDFAQIKTALESAFANLRTVIDDLVQVSQKLGEGDLRVKSRAEYRGNFVEIKTGLETAINSLNGTMQQTNLVVDQVAQSVEQVRSISQDLASSSEEQSSAVEEISSNLDETDAQVKTNAENAGTANQLVNNTVKIANVGQTKMKSMTEAMEAIAVSSREISKIIKVIDEISFQTNLLALNAAVEAARAGQHGRGFAVVAQEVRNLAGRSAKAAKETSELIEDSSQRVRDGVAIGKETATSLGEIVENIMKVRDLVAEIAAASNEQAKGISQVNMAMGQVNQGAQSGSQQSEELASTADELGNLAEQLRNEVARFKLQEQQNYADQMRRMMPTMTTSTSKSKPKSHEISKKDTPRVSLPLDRDERGYGEF